MPFPLSSSTTIVVVDTTTVVAIATIVVVVVASMTPFFPYPRYGIPSPQYRYSQVQRYIKANKTPGNKKGSLLGYGR